MPNIAKGTLKSNKLNLFLFSWPIKPLFITQAWGVYRPEIYSQFGFTRHNGQDLALAPDRKIYAPCDGTIILNDYQPSGGGNYVSLLSNTFCFDSFSCSIPDGKSIPFQAGTYRVRIDFLHLEKSLVSTGTVIKEGDLLALGDNTGFSTGPHCHTQWRRVLNDGNNTHADTNDANNSFDPTQFFDGSYAADVPQTISLYTTLVGVFGKLLAYLQNKK